MLYTPGRYVFDLDVGFNSRSSLKVDGRALSTPGMCRVTPNRAACEAKGCLWQPDTAECLPAKKGAALLLQLRAPAPAPFGSPASSPVMPSIVLGSSPSAPGVASAPAAPAIPSAPAAQAAAETFAAPGELTKEKSTQGTAPATAEVVAYSPAADAFPVQGPTQQSEQEQQVAVDAQPAPAPAPGTDSAFSSAGIFPPAAMPDVIVAAVPPAPFPAPAPAPQPVGSKEVDESAGTIELKSGGHCVEVNVMVTPSARSLALRYKGPDTSGKMTTVPGQVLFCDPAVSACEDAGPNTCANFA